jgi:hypothetical protein
MSSDISGNRTTSKSLDIPRTFTYQEESLLVYANLQEYFTFDPVPFEGLLLLGLTECVYCRGEFYVLADSISMTGQDHAFRTGTEAMDLWQDGAFLQIMRSS